MLRDLSQPAGTGRSTRGAATALLRSAGLGLGLALAGSASAQVTLTRIIAEDTTPTGFETSITSVGFSAADNGRAAATASNTIPADFITTFIDTRRNRFFGGLPGAESILYADEDTVLGIYQRAIGDMSINASGQLAYQSDTNSDVYGIGAGGPDNAVFFRDTDGTQTLFGQESEAVPSAYNLPGSIDFRNLRIADLGNDGSIYIDLTYLTTFMAVINDPGGSRDGQTGNRYDQGVIRWDPATNAVTPLVLTGDTLDFGPDPDQTLLWSQIQPDLSNSSSRRTVSTIGSVRVAGDAGSERFAYTADLDELVGSTIDQLFLNNVAARLSDGTLVQDQTPAPVAFGGNGTTAVFEDFGEVAINAVGDWAVVLDIGDPNLNASEDPSVTQTLVLNGDVAYRLGDTVDGVVLEAGNDAFDAVALNDDGDFAFLHNDTLFLNGEVALQPGADIDGGGTLASFSGSFSLSNRQPADGGGQEVVFHFIGRDDSDPTGTPVGDDLYTFAFALASEILGDYNDNGLVEQGDLNQVLNNWGTAFDQVAASWINQRPTEGIVDQAELNVVLNRWGSDSAPDFSGAVVPEPASLLGAVTLLTLSGRRRRVSRR